MGLATAYAFLKRGLRRVLVLERHKVGHDRAASTDSTKAIRYEYAEQEIYSRMVGRSIELWRDLERATGADLYVDSGVVCWGRDERSWAARSYATLKPLGVPIEQLDPDELVRRYPQFAIADITYATYNPEGGFLRASACVLAFAEMVRKSGGEIREGAQVVGLSEREQGVDVLLASGVRVEAARVVLAAGAWGARLLPEMGVQVPVTAHRQQVVYIGGLGEEFAPGRFPVFLNLDHEFYGFPLDHQGLLKSSIHLAGPLIDPDTPQEPDPAFTEEMLSLLRRYIPGAAAGPVVLERMCMYAMTPDEDFIIDRLPGYRGVTLAAGFSGHGFKFAPLIGELSAALAMDEPPEFEPGGFSIARFGGL
jgi:monomeric sarcosine oxidase